MRILGLERAPLHRLGYLNASRRGGVEIDQLPFVRARVDALPEGLSAIVCTSDLQGVVPVAEAGGLTELLGIRVAEELLTLSDAGTIPDPGSIGIVLAGDLYSAPGGDKRGATGDVREVWRAFASLFRWVVGVAGNHDRFGRQRDFERFEREPGVTFLDGQRLDVDGIRFGGVSWVVGDPNRPGRRSDEEFRDALTRATETGLDVLVLHQPPRLSRDQRGDEMVRAVIEGSRVPLTVCGHVIWSEPLGRIGDDRQVLNTAARVVILTP